MNSIVSVYKSPKREEMYLYVIKCNNKIEALKPVPLLLIETFGDPVHVFDLLLNHKKKLARVDVGTVLQALVEQGYYLQMPPSEQDDYIIRLPNDLLSINDHV